MNIIPRSKLYISKSTRVYSIIELILKLKRIIISGKHIQSNLNTINSFPIYCSYYYNISETENTIYDESLIFYYSDESVKLINNTELDQVVNWIKENPNKVNQIAKLKAFI